MYHGLRFNAAGACVAVPATDRVPPRLSLRSYPVQERSSWLWVWTGDPAKADPAVIPEGWGLDDPDWHLKAGSLDYAADYQLIHDNLLDLSHLDYLHETTLGAATGGRWSDEEPKIETIPGGIRVTRWLRDASPPHRPGRVDTLTSYRFLLPGVFFQEVRMYPCGTAVRYDATGDLPEPLFVRVDQQAVTPVEHSRARYYYAPGVSARHGDAAIAARMYEGVQETFMQDKTMIEAQAKIIADTDPRRRMIFIPADKAPTMFRRLMADRLATESPAPERFPTGN